MRLERGNDADEEDEKMRMMKEGGRRDYSLLHLLPKALQIGFHIMFGQDILAFTTGGLLFQVGAQIVQVKVGAILELFLDFKGTHSVLFRTL